MTSRFAWLGGRANARAEGASKKRARAHKARLARESRRSRRDQTNRPRWND